MSRVFTRRIPRTSLVLIIGIGQVSAMDGEYCPVQVSANLGNTESVQAAATGSGVGYSRSLLRALRNLLEAL